MTPTPRSTASKSSLKTPRILALHRVNSPAYRT